MKKTLTLVAAMLFMLSMAAKNRHVVVHPHIKIKDNTEVTTGTSTDTLHILPGQKITDLIFEAKTAEGITLFHQQVPANVTWVYTLDLPDLPNGFLFTIRDNNGVVYSNYEIH